MCKQNKDTTTNLCWNWPLTPKCDLDLQYWGIKISRCASSHSDTVVFIEGFIDLTHWLFVFCVTQIFSNKQTEIWTDRWTRASLYAHHPICNVEESWLYPSEVFLIHNVLTIQQIYPQRGYYCYKPHSINNIFK